MSWLMMILRIYLKEQLLTKFNAMRYLILHLILGGFKDLTKTTASDKTLCNKAFNIAKNSKYDGY